MKTKLCFIGGGLEGGGQERALTNMANYFSENDYEVSIINLYITEKFFEVNSNIELYWPRIERGDQHRLLYALKLFPYLQKSVRKIKPNIIFSYGEWYNAYVILCTLNFRIPIYVFDRMGPNISLGKLLGRSRRFLYGVATGVVVQTNTAAEILSQKIIAKRIHVIPNPVNPVEGDTTKKKKQIVTVGRLSKEKGHIVLLRAFAQLNYPDWSLHLVGDGPERESLEKEAALLNISDRVKFYGHLKNFKKILLESQIFVLSSFYEGFPNALLEAMSVPLACVSSNCVAGPADIIEHRVNGLLVETNNVTELAQSLDELIRDENFRKQLAAKAIEVRERYSFEKVANMVEQFILA
jgi:glycosyltransferase involved in cell wall biosynthesis